MSTSGTSPASAASGRRPARTAWYVVLAILVAPQAGCRYERIVRYDPMLAGLPGAESGTPVIRADGRTFDPLAAPKGGLRQEDEQGNVVLHSKSARHLLIHIVQTIENDEGELFVEQLLSERTKLEFAERDLDPMLAFEELKRRQRDVFTLYNALPMGELTPGVRFRTLGDNLYRVEVPRSWGRAMRWRIMDMVRERGNFRLRWFG